jgi:hypothetical protein
MGDQDDLPFDQQKKVQQRRLHKESQPVDKLDRVIEEIRRLMLRSAQEVVSKEKLDRKEPARETGEMQEQQRNERGAERQLQEKVWDPGGFQQSWEAHEQELMIFIAMEYDAGASLHLITCANRLTCVVHIRGRERCRPLIFPSRI